MPFFSLGCSCYPRGSCFTGTSNCFSASSAVASKWTWPRCTMWTGAAHRSLEITVGGSNRLSGETETTLNGPFHHQAPEVSSMCRFKYADISGSLKSVSFSFLSMRLMMLLQNVPNSRSLGRKAENEPSPKER